SPHPPPPPPPAAPTVARRSAAARPVRTAPPARPAPAPPATSARWPRPVATPHAQSPRPYVLVSKVTSTLVAARHSAATACQGRHSRVGCQPPPRRLRRASVLAP